MNDWPLTDEAIRRDTADAMEETGHLYWAARLRALKPIVDFRTAGEAEDVLAEINTALGLGLTKFERRAT